MGAFKGWQSVKKNPLFAKYQNITFPNVNRIYGFSDCTFWMDASYGLNTQTDLAAVSSWKDKINNYAFVQAMAGNQVRFNAANALYNNYPTIESTTNNKFLDAVSNPLWGGTIALVANFNIVSNLCALFGSVASSPNYWIGLDGTIGGTGVNYFNNSTFFNTTTRNTAPKIAVLGAFGILVNGVKENSSNLNLKVVSFNRLFSSAGGTTNGLIGYAAEMLGYNQLMTEAQGLTLSRALNSKYNIY